MTNDQLLHASPVTLVVIAGPLPPGCTVQILAGAVPREGTGELLPGCGDPGDHAPPNADYFSSGRSDRPERRQ
jgi:hypothetical protein